MLSLACGLYLLVRKGTLLWRNLVIIRVFIILNVGQLEVTASDAHTNAPSAPGLCGFSGIQASRWVWEPGIWVFVGSWSWAPAVEGLDSSVSGEPRWLPAGRGALPHPCGAQTVQ